MISIILSDMEKDKYSHTQYFSSCQCKLAKSYKLQELHGMCVLHDLYQLQELHNMYEFV